jgi:hypothetical protein
MLAVVKPKTSKINHNISFKRPQITMSFSHINQLSGKTAHFQPRAVSYTLKYYSLLVSHADDEQYTWLNEAQKGEAGQFAAWLCIQQMVL